MRGSAILTIAFFLTACRSNLTPSFSVEGGVWTGFPDCRICIETDPARCGFPGSQDIQLQMTTTMCVDLGAGFPATQTEMRTAIIEHLTTPSGKDYDPERVYGCIFPPLASGDSNPTYQAITCDPAVFPTTFENQSIIASIAPAASTLAVKRTVDFGVGTVTARGDSHLRGRALFNFDSLTLRHLLIEVDDFDLKAPNIGTVSTFRDGRITLLEGPITSPVNSDGMFQFPAEAMKFVITGRENGNAKTRLVVPSDPARGRVDTELRSIAVNLAGASGEESYSIALTGTIVNEPPVARISIPATLECANGARGATVQLDGSGTSDADGADDIVHFLWSINGKLAGTGPAPTVHLPLGTNRVTLLAIDGSDAIGKATVEVLVEDTQPPELIVTAEPECLWPPSHKLVHYGLGDGLSVSASDACTGAAGVSVRVVDVASSQSSDARGDGNAVTDLMFNESAVCLRAERSGLGERTYSLTVEAVDEAGNRAERTSTVLVPHDRRRPGTDRCGSLPKPHDFLDDGNPACAFSTSRSVTDANVFTGVLQ